MKSRCGLRGRGEVSGRSGCHEDSSSLCFPCGPGHGTTRDPSLPESVPCWLARAPGTRQGMQTSSGQVPSSRDQSTVPGEAPAHLSQVLGVKGRSSMERSPLFASEAAGRADCCWWRWPGRRVREAPLAVRIRHRDRRTREQHYHSKDPMGAIQQIPY